MSRKTVVLLVKYALVTLGIVFHSSASQREACQQLKFPHSDMLPQRLASSTGSIMPGIGMGWHFTGMTLLCSLGHILSADKACKTAPCPLLLLVAGRKEWGAVMLLNVAMSMQISRRIGNKIAVCCYVFVLLCWSLEPSTCKILDVCTIKKHKKCCWISITVRTPVPCQVVFFFVWQGDKEMTFWILEIYSNYVLHLWLQLFM